MIPRSVPVMAKRPMVSFGLSGPVTQPTIDVPGGAARCGRRGGGRDRLASGTADRRAGGVGDGATAACCCTCAERGVAS